MNTNNTKQTALLIAERAFAEAVSQSYPADLIKRLYDDLVQERKRAARFAVSHFCGVGRGTG